MTTRSLILSPHEVRAALDGRLGLVVRPVSKDFANAMDTPRGPEDVAAGYPYVEDEYGDAHKAVDLCPLGVPGEKLCCKEMWAEAGDFVGWDSPQGKRPEGVGVIAYRADNELRQYSIMLKGPERFKATDLSEYSKLRWRSPATMPAWASRITLEVVGVRCVRVRELCSGKGLESMAKETWDAKYANRYPWDSNPWAWAAEVRRVEG